MHLADQAQLTIEKGSANTRKIHVKVGRKDSLLAISKRYKVSVADIKSWNKLHKDQVTSGQSLVLQVAVTDNKGTSSHSAKRGHIKVAKTLTKARQAANHSVKKSVASNTRKHGKRA
jgi:membrane-bound lytic murein transglycosylase D